MASSKRAIASSSPTTFGNSEVDRDQQQDEQEPAEQLAAVVQERLERPASASPVVLVVLDAGRQAQIGVLPARALRSSVAHQRRPRLQPLDDAAHRARERAEPGRDPPQSLRQREAGEQVDHVVLTEVDEAEAERQCVGPADGAVPRSDLGEQARCHRGRTEVE